MLRAVPAPELSIIVPMHGRPDLTDRCLRRLFAVTPGGNLQCLVVDDASPTPYEPPAGLRHRVDVERLTRNVGFGGACMAGARRAAGRRLLFLNNDVDVTPGWVDGLLAAATVRAATVVGPRVLHPDGTLQEAGGIVWQDGRAWTAGDHQDPQTSLFGMVRDVDFVSGAAMLIERAAFEEAGGFDPIFGRGYYEDVDLCFRLRAKGHRIVYTPFSTVVHARSQSFDDGEDRKVAMLERNRSVFFERWRHELHHRFEHGTRDGIFGGKRTERLRALIIDWNVPQHDREAGGLRMRDIATMLAEAGCRVTFFPLDGECSQPYVMHLQENGVEVRCGAGPIDDLVEERAGAYDLVLSSRPDITDHVLPAIRRWQPLATLVYDAVDLHFVREERQRSVEGRPDTLAERHAADRERRLLRMCDLVTAVSANEAATISAVAPGQRVMVLPIVHRVGERAGPIGGRSGVLFVGGMRHGPNLDGILWYLDAVHPLLHTPTARRTVIAGPNPTERLLERADTEVQVAGFVPDVDPLLAGARMVICPVRFGAGVKGKVLQAMAHGVPVVTTPVGAEGTGLIDGVHALIRDDADGFAAAVELLAADDDLWHRLSTASLDLARETVAPDRLRERVAALVAAIEVEPAARARWRP